MSVAIEKGPDRLYERSRCKDVAEVALPREGHSLGAGGNSRGLRGAGVSGRAVAFASNDKRGHAV